MKYGIYSIRDAAAHVFTAPTIDLTDDSAIRAFSQALYNHDSLMNFCPSDFALYLIGNFNVEDGTIEPENPPVKLISGDCIAKSDGGSQ